jgi:hypothetical protein
MPVILLSNMGKGIEKLRYLCVIRCRLFGDSAENSAESDRTRFKPSFNVGYLMLAARSYQIFGC